MQNLVLMPGLMCDARLFREQIFAFSDRYAITTIPLLGETSIEALAQSCLENMPQKCSLLGLSMGGIVAMEIIRQAPERIERLALLDTNADAEAPEVATRRDAQIAKAQNDELRSVLRDELKPHYLADGPQRQDILDTCMQMGLHLGPDVFEQQSRALQKRPDQRDRLSEITVPTLVLYGKQDRLCPRARHTLMADAIPKATLVEIEGAGHLPVLERPKETNEWITKWMSWS